MSAYSDKASRNLKIFDIRKELISLTPLLHRIRGFPRASFEFESKGRTKSKFSFPCVEPKDLHFCSFYGDTWLVTPSKFSRKMTVERMVCRKSPSEVRPELFRGIIADCVDSVSSDDKEFATLKLIVGRVYFESQSVTPIDDHNKFFEGEMLGDQYNVHLLKSKLSFTHQTCEWTSPNNVLKFLKKNGFSVTSREALGAEMLLSLSGGQLRKRVADNEFLYFGNNLTLNPSTLAVESWRVQNWYPSDYYIMHGFPSSNDIIIRTNVKRYANLAELFKLKGEKLPGLMAVDDDSGSFIQRTDVCFKLTNKYEHVKCITEMESGERVHFKYKDIPCFMNLATMRYYHFNQRTNEFTLTDEQSCESVIEFPLTENREELIEAVTELSSLLFSKANDANELALTVSPQYHSEPDGTRVSWLDVQAIRRLYHEQGDLYQLIDFGENPSRNECKRKIIALKSLLLRSWHQEWFKRMDFNFNELMEKLNCACLAYNISL